MNKFVVDFEQDENGNQIKRAMFLRYETDLNGNSKVYITKKQLDKISKVFQQDKDGNFIESLNRPEFYKDRHQRFDETNFVSFSNEEDMRDGQALSTIFDDCGYIKTKELTFKKFLDLNLDMRKWNIWKE